MTLAPPSGPELRDIHVPGASWWPLAPGWWLVLGLLVIALLALAWWLPRWWRRRRLQRAVDVELARIEHQFRDDADAVRLSAGLSQLLRRVARRAGADSHLHGQAWRSELERLAPDMLDDEQMTQLQQAPYQRQAALDGDKLLRSCRRWLHQALGRGHA